MTTETIDITAIVNFQSNDWEDFQFIESSASYNAYRVGETGDEIKVANILFISIAESRESAIAWLKAQINTIGSAVRCINPVSEPFRRIFQCRLDPDITDIELENNEKMYKIRWRGAIVSIPARYDIKSFGGNIDERL